MRVYKVAIRPMATNGVEMMNLMKVEEGNLWIFERKRVRRNMYPRT